MTESNEAVVDACTSATSDTSLLSPLRQNIKHSKVLPPSCTDLSFRSPQTCFEIAVVYEVLHRFSLQLRLSPFIIEDFCAALVACNECGSLLNEIFLAVIRVLLRDDASSGTTYCGWPVGRESVAIWLYSLDVLTWPEICRAYLDAQPPNTDVLAARNIAAMPNFPFVSGENRLIVLHCLTDLVLTTRIMREELNGDAVISQNRRVDDVCRKCNGVGNLIRCESCPASFHPECADPPISETVNDVWFCAICIKHHVAGVFTSSDKFAAASRSGGFLRHSLVGVDKENRYYWFVARRLFIEEVTNRGRQDVGSESCVLYYSSVEHIKWLLEHFARSRNSSNQELYKSLKSWFSAMAEDVALTKTLTDNEALKHGLVRTVLQADVNNLLNFQNSMTSQSDWDSSFRLGDGGAFRHYENQYTINAMALNDRQKKEDNDQRTALSKMFCVMPPNSCFDFQWASASRPSSDEITWSIPTLVDALRASMLSLESSLPRSHAFFMPGWLTSPLAGRWRRAVSLCSSPGHFALAILILESNLRMVSFLPVWWKSGGHLRIQRITHADLEEAKLREQMDLRQQRKVARQAAAVQRIATSKDNDSAESDSSDSDMKNETSVKFTKKIHHCIWRQKGEEYRLQIGGGWFWQRRSSSCCSPGYVNRVNVARRKRVRRTTGVVDSLLQHRISMVDKVTDQQKALQQIIDQLKLGRQMSSLFPPAILSLPDNLHPSIRHLPISLESTVEQLSEMYNKLEISTSEPIRLKQGKLSSKATDVSLKGLHRFQAFHQAVPNIFVLPRHLVAWVARRGGFVDVIPGYINQTHHSQSTGNIWYKGIPPRPCFRTAWEYRTSLLAHGAHSSSTSFAAVGLQLRTLAACLRFDEIVSAPPRSTDGVPLFAEVNDRNFVSRIRELLKARLDRKDRRRFQYLIRLTSVAVDGTQTSSEIWLSDLYLELWEVRLFHERLSRLSLEALNENAARNERISSPSSQSTALMRVPTPSPSKNVANNSSSQEMQELRITQLPNGQVTIKGLVPGQYMVRLPDGSFQLVTMTPMLNALPSSSGGIRDSPQLVRETPQKSVGRATLSPKVQVTSPKQHFNEPISQIKCVLKDNTSKLRRHILAKRRLLEQSFADTETVTSSSVSQASGMTSPQPTKTQSAKKMAPSSCDQSEIRCTKKMKTMSTPEPVVIAKPTLQQESRPEEEQSIMPSMEIEPLESSLVPLCESVIPEDVDVLPASNQVNHQNTEELYCICRTPYDQSLFYIGCDKCSGWFHGSCVGITEQAAQTLDVYYCDECKSKQGIEVKQIVEAPSQIVDKDEVQPIVKEESPIKCVVSELPTNPPESSSPRRTSAEGPSASGGETCARSLRNRSKVDAATEGTASAAASSSSRSRRSGKVASSSPPDQKPDTIAKTGKKASGDGDANKHPDQKPDTVAKTGKKASGDDDASKHPDQKPDTIAKTGKKASADNDANKHPDQKHDTVAKTGKKASGPSSKNGAAGEELYCICRTSYDETEFYIGCDGCGEWYHGACVFVSESEAKWISRWLCPQCDETGRSQILLENDDLWRSVEQLLTLLQRNKKSWPFRAAVDKNLYPLYYAVIHRPIDLSLISNKVSERSYVRLDQFKFDVLLMFDNCRRFNPPESKFYHCADELQDYFLERYRGILAEHGFAESASR